MIKIPGTIPITIHPFFWLLAGLIGWFSTQSILGTAIWIGIIFISVMVHELGHALTGLACGQKVSIELMALGGVTQREGGKLKTWKEFLVILNGPVAGFLLYALSWALYRYISQTRADSELAGLFFLIAYVNLFWTIVNLLPIQPMDGGKLLSLFLESLFGLKGIKIGLFISLLFAIGMSLLFFFFHFYLAGSLFFLFAYESWQSWQNIKLVSAEDQNQDLQHLLREAERELRLGRKEEAITRFTNIRALSKSGMIYNTASERMAEILFEQRDLDAAYHILDPLKNRLSSNGLRLLHQIAYLQNHWDEAISLGEKIYKLMPHYEIAFMNAIAHSLLGHVRQANGWLHCAIRDGLPNVKQSLSRKEFDALRMDPQFPKL